MKNEHIIYPHQIFDSIYIMYWMLLYERKEINNEDFKWIIGKDNFEALKNNELFKALIQEENGKETIQGFEFEIDKKNVIRFDLFENGENISDKIQFVRPDILQKFIKEYMKSH